MSEDTFRAYSVIMNKLDEVLDLVDSGIDPVSITMAQLNDISEYADMLKQRVNAIMQRLGEPRSQVVKNTRPEATIKRNKR